MNFWETAKGQMVGEVIGNAVNTYVKEHGRTQRAFSICKDEYLVKRINQLISEGWRIDRTLTENANFLVLLLSMET